MTTTMHDTTLRWQDCPVCARLQRELEQARVEREQAWSTLSGVDLQFREAMDAGRAYIGTTAWQRWRDLLDSLTLQDDLAAKHLQATLAAWGESIREHAEPQPAEAEEPATISMADAADGQAALAELWYNDVPEINLPASFANLDQSTLTHCARTIGLYLRTLKRYAPVSDDAYHVAHRLMDAFDKAAVEYIKALSVKEGGAK